MRAVMLSAARNRRYNGSSFVADSVDAAVD